MNAFRGRDLAGGQVGSDMERERISLGIKQMDDDPFTNYTAIHDKGTLVTGKVKAIDAKGATIALTDDIEGYLRASEVSRERVEDIRTHLKEGDEIEAVIVNVDRKTLNINLSIKAKDSAEEKDAMKRMVDESPSNAGTTNLGALLKAKLKQGE